VGRARKSAQKCWSGYAVTNPPMSPEQWLKLFEAQMHAQALAAIFAAFPETVLISMSRA
jgi:hypothetical protein